MAAAECPAAVRIAGLATVLLLLLPGVRAITGESEILERILNPTKYDRNVRPPAENGTGGPVDVKIDLLLRRLLAVSEANMDFTAQLSVVLTWHDPRLRYDDMDTGRRRFVTLTEVSRAWQPDVFFSEEKQGHVHDIVTPNVYMRISPDGLVRFSVRTSMAFACDMDFRRYPMDTQTCTISMQSYGYTEEDLRLSWGDRDEVHLVKQHSSAGLFSIASLQAADCTARARGAATSCLRAVVRLWRDPRPALLRAYLPSALLVAASWAAFWMRRRWGRVAAAALAAAGVAYVTTPPLAALPPLPYSPALRLWRDACLGFLACAVLQVLVVAYLAYDQRCRRRARLADPEAARQQQQQQQQQEAAPSQAADTNSSFGMKLVSPAAGAARAPSADEAEAEAEGEESRSEGGWLRAWLGSPAVGGRLDIVCRAGFPAAFALFNLTYWAAVLN
ncbi:glutamate-gated chloride channel-like [Schistocerca gregaria]|uniref:glutamate-gated chloride channel-like n=1 Tax=Schistocerca gregaria TaxID=7010 RepID=UPI00211E6394|nr:glutamate-gated chloride channel-like [Schistocerca gregaria]